MIILARFRRLAGFTLIELAVVLFIVAVLLASLLGPITTRVEQADREETQRRLEEIREALYGFVIVNGRLPCPDCRNAADCPTVGSSALNDGFEDVITSAGVLTCAMPATLVHGSVSSGNLPWVNLGVSANDAWDRRFRYFVVSRYANNLRPNPDCSADSTAVGVSIALCSARPESPQSAGTMEVWNAATGGLPIARFLPAVVISYGRNGEAAAASNHELQNVTPLATSPPMFVSRVYSRDATDEFDDLLTWLLPTVLTQKMVSAGRLP